MAGRVGSYYPRDIVEHIQDVQSLQRTVSGFRQRDDYNESLDEVQRQIRIKHTEIDRFDRAVCAAEARSRPEDGPPVGDLQRQLDERDRQLQQRDLQINELLRQNAVNQQLLQENQRLITALVLERRPAGAVLP
jgi:hypothetical protein